MAEAHVLLIPNSINLRELGGYQTADGKTIKRGKILRSGSLAKLDEAGSEELYNYGTRYVIDLRKDSEVRVAPDQLANDMRYQQLSVYPFVDQPSFFGRLKQKLSGGPDKDSMTRTYERMLTDSHANDVYRGLMETLMMNGETDTAVLFHCTAGKDRTGVGAMMIAGALGVPEATIKADYLLTNDVLRGSSAQSMRSVAHSSGSGQVNAMNKLNADATCYNAVHALVTSEYGDWQNYCQRQLGLSAGDLADFRANYLQ